MAGGPWYMIRIRIAKKEVDYDSSLALKGLAKMKNHLGMNYALFVSAMLFSREWVIFQKHFL